jgi:segregation and condensation protein B
MNLKKKVESVLFAAGRKLTLEEISKLVRVYDLEKIEAALQELKGEYEARDSSIHLTQSEDDWKLTVRDDYLPTVRKIVRQTELTKSVMETLAVVAYKSPVLQSDIIKIRTNKAYDHLSLLENQGFISRAKKGRTKLIKLSNKFFEYFDVPPDKLKERFSNVAALEKAVEEKESEVQAQKEDLDKRREELKKDEKEWKEYVSTEHERLDKELDELPEIELIDEQGEEHELDTYETTEQPEQPEPEKQLEGVQPYGTKEETPEKKEATEERPEEKKEELEKEELVEEKSKEETPDLIEEAKKEVLVEEAEKALEESEAEEQTPEPDAPSQEQLMEEKAERIAAGEESTQFEGEGVFSEGMSDEVQHKVDERVEEIVHGEKEQFEEDEE